jgi:hypothetical protein
MRSVLSALRGLVPEFKSSKPPEKRPDYRLGARRGPAPGPAVAILKAPGLQIRCRAAEPPADRPFLNPRLGQGPGLKGSLP